MADSTRASVIFGLAIMMIKDSEMTEILRFRRESHRYWCTQPGRGKL